MRIMQIGSIVVTFLLAPLLPGIITKVKAWFGGRWGAPILQPYYDIIKLLRKNVVYSRSTSWIFRASPAIGLGGIICAVLLLPQGGSGSVLSFQGDMVALIYILGIIRFFMIVAALDTASSFEGMGASRDVFFSLLAEPVLFISLAVLVKNNGSFSLVDLLNGSREIWGVSTLLISASLFIVLLAENCRIPVDDPTTHLELTMIHEVMVLDNSGPEFGWILYTSSVKLWIFCSICVQVILPTEGLSAMTRFAILIGGILVCAAGVGVVESAMARLRLTKVPQLLVGAGALAVIAFLFSSKGGL
jgi:formate hydrogenlyase subunit 4